MASAQIQAQKQAVVDALVEKIKASVSGVLVDYKGINVEDDTKLRAELRKAGVEYKVIKNTLIARACDEVGYTELKDCLTGMTAFAISNDDQVVAAKILNDYAKNHDNFVLKAGYCDGKTLDADGIKALAEIPSKEVLIGRMLGSLQSSLYSFAYVLQAIIDKNGEGAEAPAAE
ncbi:MAG: 50S ribosomal protein L10 [Clostridia bacterium]|nr:50S ribosomal protein L10 [Clostridia bacterium]MBQ7047745.1 50S ribosomal protein L10 [Clostridia bacterium]